MTGGSGPCTGFVDDYFMVARILAPLCQTALIVPGYHHQNPKLIWDCNFLKQALGYRYKPVNTT